MKKLMTIACGALLAAGCQAGTYTIGHFQECPALSARQTFDIINQVGIEEGLDLPKGQRISGETRCFVHPTLTDQGTPVYAYFFKVIFEKEISDGANSYWVKLRQPLERVSYGLSSPENIKAGMRQETRKLIRMLN